MQSNGGISKFELASRTPIHLVESGPVGGVIGAAAISQLLHEDNIITLDIGGTTAKSSLVERGEIRVTSDYYIERTPTTAGYPIKVPVVDIVEIGAGGGSIAWIDPAGALKVGPRSAGAEPGPAAMDAAAARQRSLMRMSWWAVSIPSISSVARFAWMWSRPVGR